MAEISVEIPGMPRFYQRNALPGWKVIGQVSIAGTTGALVEDEGSGEYAMARDGILTPVDRKAVRAALGIEKRGRPKSVREGRKVYVYLGEEEVEIARKLGDGSVSAGIRVALRQFG